jgi:hypothetical protein
MRESFAANTRGVAQNLVVPHGFTLVIGGTLAILIGERGYPGAMGIWLFIAGANGALLGCVAVLRGHRHPVAAPVSGFGVFNMAPTLTVPLVYGLVREVHSDKAAFLCAGLLSVLCYVLLVAGLAVAAFSRRAGDEPY